MLSSPKENFHAFLAHNRLLKQEFSLPNGQFFVIKYKFPKQELTSIKGFFTATLNCGQTRKGKDWKGWSIASEEKKVGKASADFSLVAHQLQSHSCNVCHLSETYFFLLFILSSVVSRFKILNIKHVWYHLHCLAEYATMQEVKDWIYKLFISPENLGWASVLIKAWNQIQPQIVGLLN